MNKVYLDCTRPFGDAISWLRLAVLIRVNGFCGLPQFWLHFLQCKWPCFDERCCATWDQHRLSPTLEGDQVGSAPLISNARGELSGIDQHRLSRMAAQLDDILFELCRLFRFSLMWCRLYSRPPNPTQHKGRGGPRTRALR